MIRRRNVYGCLLNETGRIAHPGVVFPEEVPLAEAEVLHWWSPKEAADFLGLIVPMARAVIEAHGVRTEVQEVRGLRVARWCQEDVMALKEEGVCGA